MFQGKPPRPGDAYPLAEGHEEGAGLRPLTWPDLVARLRVSQGMREVSEQAKDTADASFDATCAQRIAAHHNGKHGVNLDDSSYGKEAGGTAQAETKGAGSGFMPGPARK